MDLKCYVEFYSGAGNLFSAGTRSACINAATLALADAGIPMRDLVTSCSSGYLNSTPLLGKFMCLYFFYWFLGTSTLLIFQMNSYFENYHANRFELCRR